MRYIPMVTSLYRLRLLHACAGACAAITMLCTPLHAHAQQAQQPEPFTRIIVPDNKTIQVQSSGTQLVITLDTPDAATAASLKAQLGSRAKTITPSQDGKRFTITLSKPFRIRQFVGSKGAGFDVMEDTAPSVLPKPSEPTPPELIPEPVEPKIALPPAPQKPVEVPPSAKSNMDEKPTPATEPSVSKPKPADTPTQPVATKAPVIVEPEPPEVSPEEAAEPPEKAPETKEAAVLAEKPVEAATPVQPTAPAMTMTSFPMPKEALVSTDAVVVPEPIPEEPRVASATEALLPTLQPEPVNTAQPAEVKAMTDLMVGVKPTAQGIEIAFPWEHRVASALYQRDRDWWLLFNAASRIDITQLRSVLPNNITLLDPYDVPGHTVLHFVTDGKSSMSTSQKAGSYEWDIAIEPGLPNISPQAYAIEPMADAPKPYVVVRAFDIAPALAFTDPKFGDRMLVVPSYEANKATITPYQNPEFRIIPARQGIIVQLQNEKLLLTSGRDGLRIGSENGLKLSKGLPALPIDSASEADTVPNIMFPYARWRVPPERFAAARIEKTNTLANASKDDKPKALYDLATLYLGQGMSEEALSLINQLRDRFPAYYRENEIGLVRAATNFMIFRMGDAATDIVSPELANNPETLLWKDAISLFVPQILVAPPTPAKDGATKNDAPALEFVPPEPRFDYLAYNRNYIRYYPPAIRQKLAIIASDNFVARKEYSKAARTLDVLNRDELLLPIRPYAEFLLGRIAADSGRADEAIKLWQPLADQYSDLFIHARATFSLATLEYSEGKRTLDETVKALERLRVAWRGDTLEQNLLSYLGELYLEQRDYANALRTWKDYVNEYGGSIDGITISNKMAELFERLYGDEALAQNMDPLRSLALFYEFRELSPIGGRGDAIIQKLADRLAQVDLLDKAAELLEHQVKFRVQGEARARIGAQLALLQLVNKNPDKALEALELSGYGASPPALATERNRLAAAALAKLEKPEVALEMLASDRTPLGQQLRLEILWDAQDWPNVINVAEDMLGTRPSIAAPLTEKETETLLKLALAYSFESDLTQLKYLREYYSPLLKESPYKDIFEHVTNDTAILDPEDFEMVAKQISATETFLKTFKDKIADGRLSTALEEGKIAQPEAATDEPTQSERNSELVPESQDKKLPTEEEKKPDDEAPNENDAPKRAPVEVESEDVAAEEESEDTADKEKTEAEASPEKTEADATPSERPAPAAEE